MTKTSQGKIGVQFYPLTKEEIKQWYQDKLLSTAGYLLAIKKVTKLPGSNLVIPNILKFCEEWGISKSAFYRAVNELRQKGYIDWEASYGDTERQIRDRLHIELCGQVEVVTAVGRIDLLTATELIEVKDIQDWKNALGQILAYAAFFPEHSKRIHLFGKVDLAKIALAQATCSEFGITVTNVEVQP